MSAVDHRCLKLTVTSVLHRSTSPHVCEELCEKFHIPPVFLRSGMRKVQKSFLKVKIINLLLNKYRKKKKKKKERKKERNEKDKLPK